MKAKGKCWWDFASKYSTKTRNIIATAFELVELQSFSIWQGERYAQKVKEKLCERETQSRCGSENLTEKELSGLERRTAHLKVVVYESCRSPWTPPMRLSMRWSVVSMHTHVLFSLYWCPSMAEGRRRRTRIQRKEHMRAHAHYTLAHAWCSWVTYKIDTQQRPAMCSIPIWSKLIFLSLFLVTVASVMFVSECPGLRPAWPYLFARTRVVLGSFVFRLFIFSPAVFSLFLCAPLGACLLPLHLCLSRQAALGSSSSLL